MTIHEKLEECPNCGERKFWFYDGQMCANCAYGEPTSEGNESSFRDGHTSEVISDAMARLLVSSKVLLANAQNSLSDEPGWLADCRRDIEAATIIQGQAHPIVPSTKRTSP